MLSAKTEEYTLQHNVIKIEKLMQTYDMLNDIARNININYGFQILTALTVQFIKIVFSSFYVYYYKIVSMYLCNQHFNYQVLYCAVVYNILFVLLTSDCGFIRSTIT